MNVWIQRGVGFSVWRGQHSPRAFTHSSTVLGYRDPDVIGSPAQLPFKVMEHVGVMEEFNIRKMPELPPGSETLGLSSVSVGPGNRLRFIASVPATASPEKSPSA